MTVPAARLAWGDCVAIDYTPGSDVTAGDVVVQGDLVGVAAHDIADSVLGSLQVVGPGGVWIFDKTAGTSTAMTVGQVVYWDDSGDVATTTASTNAVLGKVVLAAADADTEVYVMGVQQATP